MITLVLFISAVAVREKGTLFPIPWSRKWIVRRVFYLWGFLHSLFLSTSAMEIQWTLGLILMKLKRDWYVLACCLLWFIFSEFSWRNGCFTWVYAQLKDNVFVSLSPIYLSIIFFILTRQLWSCTNFVHVSLHLIEVLMQTQRPVERRLSKMFCFYKDLMRVTQSIEVLK